MPCITSNAGARILEWFVLQSSERQTYSTTVVDQALATAGDEVRHGTSFPNMPVKPQPAVHRVDHPLASKCEFAIGAIVERAVAIDRSAAHSRAAAMSASVTGNAPLESCRRNGSGSPEVYGALLGAERSVGC